MKNYLIIGGSAGIGAALVQQLLDAGHTVYAAQRKAPNMSHPKLHYLPIDVTQGQLDITALPTSLDGFAYMPGSINLKPFKNLKAEAFLADWQLNFGAMIPLLQQVLPLLLAASKPSVVLMSSVAVGTGMPFHSSIAAAKGAIEGFTRALAAEYAPQLRVNAIAPSLTATPLADKFLNSPDKLDRAAQRHPLKQVGDPADVAALAAYLLGEHSGWITGQVWGIDGGMGRLQTGA